MIPMGVRPTKMRLGFSPFSLKTTASVVIANRSLVSFEYTFTHQKKHTQNTNITRDSNTHLIKKRSQICKSYNLHSNVAQVKIIGSRMMLHV